MEMLQAYLYRRMCAFLRLLPLLLVFLPLFGRPSVVAIAQPQSSDSEVTPEVQRLYAQAKMAQTKGDVGAAIDDYIAMLKLAPHLAPAYNNLGLLYFGQHDYVHATETLERGIKLNPDMPTAFALLGISYFEMGDSKKAEAPLRTALRNNPTDDNVEMTFARVLINTRKYEEATTPLKSLLSRHPEDQEAWYLLGKTYLQLSEDALGRINKIDPNSLMAHDVAGEIDESMHNYDGALVEYKQAAAMSPRRVGAHMHLAEVYWETSKWDSAAEEFTAELKNDPNNCNAHWKLANTILEVNGSAEDALAHLNAAIERCPGLMQAHVDRARTLLKLSQPDKALPDLLSAEKDSPKEPSIHFLLSSTYRAQGKTVDAQRELRTYGALQREASQASADRGSDAIAIKNAAH